MVLFYFFYQISKDIENLQDRVYDLENHEDDYEDDDYDWQRKIDYEFRNKQ